MIMRERDRACFSLDFLFSFVQNGLLLSKGCEGRKSFRIFLLSGVRNGWLLRLLVGKAQNDPRKRRMQMPSARMVPFPSTAFHHEKEAIHHNSGCRWQEITYTQLHRNVGRRRKFRQRSIWIDLLTTGNIHLSLPKATPDAAFRWNPDVYVHKGISLKILAGQGFWSPDADNVVLIYF